MWKVSLIFRNNILQEPVGKKYNWHFHDRQHCNECMASTQYADNVTQITKLAWRSMYAHALTRKKPFKIIGNVHCIPAFFVNYNNLSYKDCHCDTFEQNQIFHSAVKLLHNIMCPLIWGIIALRCLLVCRNSQFSQICTST